MRGITLLLLFIVSSLFAGNNPFFYLHPSPGSDNISPAVSIILRPAADAAPSDLVIELKGTLSGNHPGILKYSQGVYIYDPFSDFTLGEEVSVKIRTSARKSREFNYSFRVSETEVFSELLRERLEEERIKEMPPRTMNVEGGNKGPKVINGVSVPSDFPTLVPSTNGAGTGEGKIFISTYSAPYYMMILENDGTPYYYQKNDSPAFELRPQPNGILTMYYGGSVRAFFGMDSNFVVADTFACVNGYGTDGHECHFDEDGNYYLMAVGYRTVDMSQIVPGGSTNAFVTDNHVHKFNSDKELVLEWLSFDHMEITDALNVDLTANWIDWIHINSIAADYDDNIIISSRNLSEVTKIDGITGEIIWRLGGKNNMFTYPDGDEGTSCQHDARPVDGKPGNYLIFDNGNYKDVEYTRVIEYQVDTLAMTATKVWEYRHDPDLFSSFMGSSQRLPNGNTLINYAVANQPKTCEVTESGEIVHESDFEEAYSAYRVRRFTWEKVSPAPYLIVEPFPEKTSLVFNKFGDTEVEQYIVFAGTDEQSLSPVDTTDETFLELSDLEDEQNWWFGVKALYANGSTSPFSNIDSAYIEYIFPGENYIKNGDFSINDDNWSLIVQDSAVAEGTVIDGEYFIEISHAGSQTNHILFSQFDIPLFTGRSYKIEFDARAENERTIEFLLQNTSGWLQNYSSSGAIILTSEMQHFSHEFTMQHSTDQQAKMNFRCGNDTSNIYFDNISVVETEPSGITDNSEIPSGFALSQNYPNPFNPSTTLNYNIPSESLVSVIIYNLLGEKVKTLRNGIASPGSYSIRFDASGLASGIYICNMKADPLDGSRKFSDSKKMLLIK